jgi:hypothetical protein
MVRCAGSVLIVAAVMTAGCHWVFSYSNAGDGPGRDVPAGRDLVDALRVADGSVKSDIAVRDAKKDTALKPDLARDVARADQKTDGPLAVGGISWAKVFGSASSDQGLAIAIDGSENVYVAGTFGGAMALDPPCKSLAVLSGASDAFVVSFSSTGDCRWAASVSAPGVDVAYGVAVSGNVVFVVGQSASNVIFLATFNALTGAPGAWKHEITAGGPAAARSVAVDPQSNIYVTGFFTSSVTMPNGPALSVFGLHDVFVASFTSGGALRWSKSFGGAGNDQGRSIAVGAGLVAVTGYFAGTVSTGGTTLTSAGGQDAFLVDYNRSGAFSSFLNIGGAGNDQGLGVALDTSDVPVVVGSFEKTMTVGTTLTSSGMTDLFVRRWTAPSNWSIGCGTTAADGAAAVALDATGAVFVIGRIGAAQPSCGLALPYAGGPSDLLIGRWSAAGTLGTGWPVAFGGLGDDLGAGIAVGSSALYVVGTTTSSTLFGQTPPGTGDVFVAKIKR